MNTKKNVAGYGKLGTKEFYRKAFLDAPNYSGYDPDAFVSDLASSADCDDVEESAVISVSHIDTLRKLWHTANDSFASLLERMGMSEGECCERFCINAMTLQKWVSGAELVPGYVRLMMAEASGYLSIG